MMWWNRWIVVSVVAACALLAQGAIDRQALVSRHDVTMREFDARSPLSVGNGRFCFTADLTGLQTFGPLYEKGIPLGTLAEWGWHAVPNEQGYRLEDTFVMVEAGDRTAPYNINSKVPASNFLRATPHQTNLGQIALVLRKADGSVAAASDLTKTEQRLELWTGRLISRFELEGEPVEVVTRCHPEKDQVIVTLRSRLLGSERLGVTVRFPYPAGVWGPAMDNWQAADRHSSRVLNHEGNELTLARAIDNLNYFCRIDSSHPVVVSEAGPHDWQFIPKGAGDTIEFAVEFRQSQPDTAAGDFKAWQRQCDEVWRTNWLSGGAIDLSGSRDERWRELERRIVLSRYLTMIQSRQQYPPQETGLTCNSWFGKFHLEMHWWHSVHFALWGQGEALERTLPWYETILPEARAIAQRQGYAGVRWPKMVGPDGRDAPSGIGPLLIWQQPHPIYYAELMYRWKPQRETLERYRNVVEQTAAFMADYATWNEERKCFELGPPLLSAREFGSGQYRETKNPAFELAYWSWALDRANEWRSRLGLARVAKWDRIAGAMAPLPMHEGICVEQETPLVKDGGHPCMFAAYGLLPETRATVDKEIMRKTLKRTMEQWDWGSTWGWDYPMTAMTAARLGEGELAIRALLLDVQKNTYLPNGHNWQRPGLPLYLPGNGGLLTAVAMMAAGWEGAPERPAPGFPGDGQWQVTWEGLVKMP